MTNKGKHASQTPGTFYRDLAIMILGILVVGAAVFFVLYLVADEPTSGPTTTVEVEDTTTTEQEVTTTSEDDATTSSTEATSTTVPVRPPSEVSVIVLNSMGLDGAAASLTAELSAEGYQTLTPGNYNPEQDPSRVWYRDGYAAEATNLLPFIPGATVESIPEETIGEGADVVIVLGTGYGE